MEQHPVPQHISAYQFRLVGDMTLKQFGLLAGGAVVALLFYASPLPGYFKWPLAGIAGFGGFALAFLPIEERPLDRWLTAFFKAIYSPTQFIWKKKAVIPEFFQVTPPPRLAKAPPEVSPDQAKLAEYLKTLPPTAPKSPLDENEESFLNQISNLFQLTKLPPTLTPTIAPTPFEEEKPGIRIRRLRIPSIEPVKEKGEIKKKVAPKPVKKAPPIKKPPRVTPPTVEAKIAPELPIPAPPERPNILVGMVLSPEGKIVENAIIEIRDQKGNPVRALKTNRLGQFRIASPLKSGTYEVEAEKENLKFDIIKITLSGKIIQPIEIKAK